MMSRYQTDPETATALNSVRPTVLEMDAMYQSRAFRLLMRQYELEIRRAELWAGNVPTDQSASDFTLEAAKRQGFVLGVKAFHRMVQKLPGDMRHGLIPAEEELLNGS